MIIVTVVRREQEQEIYDVSLTEHKVKANSEKLKENGSTVVSFALRIKG